ncbi:MAG: type II toxin-antitoxin system RelE/ParE family toxin [Nitrososphaerales archaeon]
MPPDLRRRIIDKIAEFQENPFPHGVIKIHGEQDVYRQRVGYYRILFEVHQDQRALVIVKVEHRRSVYG